MKADFDQFTSDEYTAAAKPADRRGDHVRPGAFTSEQPTPYEKSGAADTQLEIGNREHFHNDRQPFYEIKHQKPEHLVMIYMKAEGQTNIEIAAKMEVSAVTVANVLKQPWARKQLKDIIANQGGNEVAALFKGAAAEAAQVLIDEMTSAETPRDRISAADKVLDRVFGKASQPIQHSYSNEDLAKLPDSELLKLASGN